MIHLAHRLARADLRTSPGRSLAVAALLVAAAWLPAAIGTHAGYGVALAAAVAFCATLGAVSLDADRDRLLEENGAGARAVAVVSAVSLVPAAVLATVAALGLRLVLGAGLSPATVLLVALVVPVASALVASWVAGQADGRHGRAGWARRTLRVAVTAALLLLAVVMPVLGLSLVALRLTAGAWSATLVRRAAGGLLALVCLAVSAVAVGSSTTWWDLGLAMLFVGPGVVVACVVLGMHAVALGAGLAGRAGPRARLALVPLTGRRRALAPLVGVIAFVAALAVSEAVVGASFGAREADRERDIPTVRASAGSSSEQAIVVVPPVDAAALRSVAAEHVEGTGAAAVVVEQLGFEAPRVPGVGPFGLIDLGGLDARVFVAPQFDPGSQRGDLDVATATGWLGIVAPADLAALGWASSGPDLDAGQVVLTSGVEPVPGGTATVVAYGTIQDMPAVAADGPTGGALLPAAIVSAATADGITPVRTTARVVVVPAPGAADPADPAELLEIARSIAAEASGLPVVEPQGLTTEQRDLFRIQHQIGTALGSVHAGDEEIVVRESGPLNDVPSLARTAEEGRGLLLAQAALALVMTVAGVLLALGATRSDDVVLEVQGAPTGLRSSVSAIQAAVIAGSAAVFAALAGIGVPAAAFSIYNDREHDLPDIPLVVPGLVWAVLLALPVLAAAASAAIPAARRPAGPDRLLALGA